jgi:beta-lysine N6-acetyltransferase
MQDIIEIFGNGSIIQHGKQNNRVYLMKMNSNDISMIINYINQLALDYKYSKIFCKIPEQFAPLFIADGFLQEAYIPHFYESKGAFFMSKYLDDNRKNNVEKDALITLQKNIPLHNNESVKIDLDTEFSLVELKEKNAEEISELYKQVFASYPFPIFDPNYIIDTMKDGVKYLGIKHNNDLISISSAEVDYEYKNAEMTDFASLPDYRGKKLSVILLQQMEIKMREMGIYTLYTIARLNSLPMNKTFLREGYSYSGTLINNTNIAGKIESMNVLYKNL